MSKIKLNNPGTLLAPLPVVMVSCGDFEKSNIITIGWCGIINSDPAKTYISVRHERFSYDIIKNSREFVINLVSRDLAKAADFCGVYTGKKVDKFAKCKLTKEKANDVKAPLISESPISIECRVTDIVPLGSHDMFISDIVNVDIKEDLFEGDKICINRAHLCAYAHGEYYELGKRIGKFGFSVKKKISNSNKGEKRK